MFIRLEPTPTAQNDLKTNFKKVNIQKSKHLSQNTSLINMQSNNKK